MQVQIVDCFMHLMPKQEDEEWAFLPPLLIGKLPTIINSSLDGRH